MTDTRIEPQTAPPDRHPESARSSERLAELALLLATVFWGCGFTWAKVAGEGVQRQAVLPPGAALGPILILAGRFLLAGLLLFLAVPAARRGWTPRGAARVGGVGLLLSAAIVVQHLGLDRTSEAVSAFLTALSVLFVPLILTLVLLRPPGPVVWAGVALATLGVWLMTGAAPTGFGLGEALGLSCAFAYSLYILAVNAAAARESAWRLTAGQFLVTGVVCLLACLPLAGGRQLLLEPAHVLHLLAPRDVWLHLLLLTLLPTLGSFGLLNFFQPRIDPTRATLIYLMEPVVAAAYAWAIMGRGLHATGLIGAGLILAANLLVEILAARAKRKRGRAPTSA